MASDGVIGQCRRILLLACNGSVRHKPQFDQGLEAVAHTKGKSVSLIEQFFYRLFDLCILEGCSEEFGRTVRFVTRAETAREHDHLRLCDGIFELCH